MARIASGYVCPDDGQAVTCIADEIPDQYGDLQKPDTLSGTCDFCGRVYTIAAPGAMPRPALAIDPTRPAAIPTGGPVAAGFNPNIGVATGPILTTQQNAAVPASAPSSTPAAATTPVFYDERFEDAPHG